MKKKNIGLLAVISILFLSGCMEVLDKRDLQTIDENIWNDATQSTLFLNGLYSKSMPSMALGEFSGFTEETFESSSTVTDLMYGIITEFEQTVVTEMSIDNYNLIRQINICIKGVENGTLDDSIKGLITGQAYFFRAFKHFNMLRFYGGIPIVTEVLDPYNDDLNIPRFATSQSVDMIVADLDMAIKQLPVEWPFSNDYGRITKGAAAAFKGRVLLYWASPQFNPENKIERWKSAFDANVEAKNYLSQMSTPRALNAEFRNIFTDPIETNPEAVIFRSYDASVNYSSDWEGDIRPGSGGGGSKQKPTWELVKAFPMINGKMTADPSSGFDSVMYWLNRDPRFYNTISYTGDNWDMNGRVTVVGNLSVDYVATYGRPNSIEGIRTPNNQGLLCRKASNPSVARDFTSTTSTTWHELRYAEVLMNLAESAMEIGNQSVMMENLKLIRERAGIEPGDDGNYGYSFPADKERMREAIMNERLAEFAYEGKRYWDLRRRLMYRNDLGTYTKKLNGTQRHTVRLKPKSPYTTKIESGIYTGLYRIDTVLMKGHFDLTSLEDYNTYFTRQFANVDYATASSDGGINYKELYDFFCIPKAILERSPAVEQTIGWQYGTFDPLEE